MNIGKSSFDVEHHLRLAVGFRWGIVVDAAMVTLGDLGGRDTTLHQFMEYASEVASVVLFDFGQYERREE